MEKKKITVNIIYKNTNIPSIPSIPNQYMPTGTIPVMQYHSTLDCDNIQMYTDLEELMAVIKNSLNNVHLCDAIIKLEDVFGMIYIIPMNNVKSIRVAPEGTPGFMQMIWPENFDPDKK